MNNNVGSKILWSRILTRSGDQAWDFAVPIFLLHILPGQLRIAALYYLIVKLINVLLLPRFSVIIDRTNRSSATKLGIFFQLLGVLIGAASIYGMSTTGSLPLLFIALTIGGILSGLGASFMDIAVANDLVPSSLPEHELTPFNARLRQIDLVTEVTAPIIAGLLLTFDHIGFYMIALWNIVSFFPEYWFLSSIFRNRVDLDFKTLHIPEASKVSFIDKITAGWRAFFAQPIAPAMAAYALLWLSALSPHGVLLTAYLKDGWNLPEWIIGSFRGAGAFFGLIATFAFPWVTRRIGLVRGARALLLSQAVAVCLSFGAFFVPGMLGQFFFLVFILISRVGLYGFSLGEMEIRQIGISSEVRGQVNGFASALTGLATLALYGIGTLLPSTEDFRYLVILSTVAVLTAFAIFSAWTKRQPLEHFDSKHHTSR